MDCSIDEAEQFLRILDNDALEFTFQTFDDNKERGKKNKKEKGFDPLAKVLNGSLVRCYKSLSLLNKKGAGVFVTANRTDLKGRENKNIVAPRCVFQELDIAPIKDDPIEPSIVVQSSEGKLHKYWLCNELEKDDFNGVIERMVSDYGSDKSAKGMARVLRLPGFYHVKDFDNPQKVSIIHESGNKYSKDEILSAFPPVIKEVKKSGRVEPVNYDNELLVNLRDALNYISPAEYQTWVNVGHCLQSECVGVGGRGLWLDWGSGYPNFDINEASKKWEQLNATSLTYKSIFMWASENGWVNPKKGGEQVNNKRLTIDSKKVDKNNIVSELDKVHKKYDIDFLSKIDSTHILAQVAKTVAHTCYLPEHSVFLTGLGVISAITCRTYKVNYKFSGSLPLGLYVMAEQPSGAAKSRSLNAFQKPFRDAFKENKSLIDQELAELRSDPAARTDDDIKDKIAELKQPVPPLFVTNATAEALEQILEPTGGYFAAISSEKGLANTILGACYGDSTRANNNDVLLNGFDGGHVASIRVTRSGYQGSVVGSTVVIAQPGSIESLLSESDGTGLSERFLLLAEDHFLGTRNFLDDRFLFNEVMEDYNDICLGLYDKMTQTIRDYDDLIELDICKEGHILIAEYRNSIEKDLLDGGRLSDIAIRGACAKADMQIMKIAANLHVMSCNHSSGFGIDTTIDKKYVSNAIAIVNEMIESNLALCVDKGINGLKAEYESILTLFEKSNQPRTARTIIQVKSKTSLFKEMTFEKGETKSGYIRSLLQMMVDDDTLVLSMDGSGNEVYRSS